MAGIVGHPDYPWIERDSCGTCGSRRWRVIDTPSGRVARCESCLPRLAEGERAVERITLGARRNTDTNDHIQRLHQI